MLHIDWVADLVLWAHICAG